MKKRILTLILATVMTITMMPASVFALNASQGESDINETEAYDEATSQDPGTDMPDVSDESGALSQDEVSVDEAAPDPESNVTEEAEPEKLEPAEPEQIKETPKSASASDFTYTEINGSFARITGYTGEDTEVVIPSAIDDYTIQAIGDGVFENSAIVSVEIPDTVESIGSRTFKGCTGLTEVKFGVAVTSIGEQAFSGCTGLTEIDLPPNLKSVGYRCFYGCTGLPEVSLPDTVTSIGAGAFANCTNLALVNYPKALTSTGGSVFSGDPLLTEITVPEGVTTLATHAFEGCTNLTKVNLPTTLTAIGERAFEGCTGLDDIDLPEGLKSIGYRGFYGCTGFTEVKLPNTVTTLSGGAFAGCTKLATINYPMSLSSTGSGILSGDTQLKEMTVPEGVTTLVNSAFSGCPNLKKVNLPSTLTVIEEYAFNGCTGLTDIDLPEGLTSINYHAFYGCTGFTEIKVPDTVTSIGAGAFANCTKLASINYPKSLTHSGGSIFSGDTLLKEITVPEGVTTLVNSAFSGCTYLTKVNLPTTLTSIEEYAFNGCTGLTELQIPDSVTSIGYHAYYGCTGLTSVNYPASLEAAGSGIYANCSKLKSITVPDGVTDIPANAFNGANTLTRINLPDTVIAIGNSAFEGCTSIKGINIPDGVNSIEEYAFYGCTALLKFTVPAGVKELKYGTFTNCTAMENIWIGPAVTSINDNAFGNCSTDKLVIHGESGSTAETWAANKGYTFSTTPVDENESTVTGKVTDASGVGIAGIGVSVYDLSKNRTIYTDYTGTDGSWYCDECVVGTEYMISYSCTNYTFSKNGIKITAAKQTEVETVVAEQIIEGLEETDGSEFTYVTVSGNDIKITAYNGSSETVSIPRVIDGQTVVQIDGIFNGNKTIKTVAIPEGVTSIGESIFEGCTSLSRVLLPSTLTTMDSYVFYGCTGLEDIDLPANLKSLGYRAFYGCTGLTEVQLPDTVTSIGAGAFANCTKLASVNYPKSLTSSGGSVFSGDTLLTEITVPEGVTKLANSAFEGCKNLTKVNLPTTLTAIGESAFEGCTGIEDIDLPASLTAIDSYAFNGCTGLTDIDLPEGLTSIGYHAFYGCTGFTEIKVPDTVTSIGAGAFANCTKLASINYPKSLTHSGGSIFSGDTLLKEITVPEGVTTLVNSAFSGCTYLTKVNLPTTLTSIEEYAFNGCTGLTELQIPDSVTSIGYHAYYGCTGLTKADLPDTIETMGAGAFANCTNLSTVHYPTSLSSSGGSLFSGCTKLKSITIPDGVTAIPDDALSSASGLTSLTMPDTVETIGRYAFNGCSNLQTVLISGALKSIGAYAFNDCTSLKFVSYPKSEEEWNEIEIGDYNTPLGNAVFFFNGEGGGLLTPPSVPALTGAAYGHKQIRLNWTYDGDTSNVKRYELSRSDNGILFESVRNLDPNASSFLDALSFEGGSKKYYYKITVVDKYDRTETSETIEVTAVSEDKEPPHAVINPANNVYAVVNDMISFSAALSTDNDRIASYAWDLGNGKTGSGKEISTRYTSAGTYTATLTVTDLSGNTDTASVKVLVIDKADETYTLLTLTVVDSSSDSADPVANAQVSLTKDEKTDTFTTNNKGQITQLMTNGEYVVSIAADGYLPRTVKIACEGGELSKTIGIISKDIMAGSITVEEMDYDEIIEAGIDVNAEGNQHVYKFATVMTFVAGPLTYEFPVTVMKNENNDVVGRSGSGFFDLGHITPGEQDGWASGLRIGIFPITEKFILVIYGEAHWLKEMYKVELVVNNKSLPKNHEDDTLEDITLEDIHGELILPNGMSLADMVSGAQSLEKDLGSLGPNESTSAEWFIRGDKEGEYTIGARVTATAMPYGNVIEQLYETSEPVKVLAGSALHLTITCDDVAKRGEEYKVKYKLENVSEKSLYNLSFGLTGSAQYKVIGFGDNEAALPITGTEFGEEWIQRVDELAPGGYIELELSTTIWFNSVLELVAFSDVGAFVDIGYYLTDVSQLTLEGSTTEIPYDIVVNHTEREFLIDKIIDEVTDQFLEANGIEIPDGNLGGMYIELLDQDLDIGFAKNAKTVLSLMQGSTDYVLTITIDDGKVDGYRLYNDHLYITTSEGAEAFFDVINGNKLTVKAGEVSIQTVGPGRTKAKIGIETSFGEQKIEYTHNITVGDEETKTSVTFQKDQISGTYKSSADNFDQTVTIHKNKELNEYRSNPFQMLDSTVEVDVTGHTEDTEYAVTLTGDEVKKLINDTTTRHLLLKGDAASMSFSRKALSSMPTDQGDLTFQARKLDAAEASALGTANPVYSFSAATAADPDKAFAGGPVTVSVPYEMPTKAGANSVSVRHIKDDGSEEMLDAQYDAATGTVSFETNSFSYFEIIGPESGTSEDTAEVTELIQNLPDVSTLTLDDAEKVNEAMAAYNNLSEEDKAAMNAEDVEKLIAAADRIKELEEASQPVDPTPTPTPTPAPVVTPPAPSAPAEIQDLPAVKISKPAPAKKAVTVKWKKVTKKNLKKIQGIEIQVATDPGFTDIVKATTTGKKKTRKKIKGLISKQTYYVRVRAYKDAADGKHVSAWRAKKVKIK